MMMILSTLYIVMSFNKWNRKRMIRTYDDDDYRVSSSVKRQKESEGQSAARLFEVA